MARLTRLLLALVAISMALVAQATTTSATALTHDGAIIVGVDAQGT